MPDNLHDTKPRPAVSAPPDIDQKDPTQPKAPTPRPTQPQPPANLRPPTAYTPPQRDEVPAPPSFLLWGVIGLFVLGIVGVVGSIAAFRLVLEPAQQERVMQFLPFMEAFLPPRPAPDDTLPTPESPAAGDLSPDDLLSGLTLGGEASLTPDAQPTLPPTAEPTLAPTATLEPTLAPTQEAVQPTLAPTQIVAVEPTTPPAAAVVNDVATRPRNARMTGFVYQKQTWNNCGPSNITMALSYYGWRQDQAFAAQFLKPGGREDKNVSPSEMVAFVNEQSAVRALYRIGGTVELIKTLLANNFPVIIETGFMPEGYDWIGHYRTLSGYDENQGVFYVYDSFLGQVNGDPIPDSFTVMDSMWRHFNRTFIVVYEPQREALLQELLGDYWEVEKAAQIALETATAEARADSTDGHAWFNLGSSLARLGDFERAALAYDRARVEGVPWRMTWYQFEPFEAYYGAGRYNEVISLAEANIANGAQYVEETYYWQGRALQALGRTTEAGTAYRNALRRNPSYDAAQTALNALGS